MKKRLIPKAKINNLRFGQLIINVLQEQYVMDEDFDISSLLFYISNDDLEKLIQKFLEEYGKS